MNFSRRRLRNSGALLLALGAVWAWVRAGDRSLGATSFSTGYLLLAALFFLALYNVRKKFPFLPLGSSAAWLQWHLYLGLGTVGLFALHAGPALPRGTLDVTLAAAYLLTVASGLAGLYLSRVIPPQLARMGEEVLYERIPAHRRSVRDQAGAAVLDSVAASGATTLADFYMLRLYDYFGHARGWAYGLRPTAALRRSLMREMQDLRRYLTHPEQAACERLFALVRRKDDLDFHESRQRLLKLWLFLHIGLTYTLLLLALLHGVLAHAFHGGGA